MQEPYTPGMQADNVSWWIDGLWINGSEIDVPNMSVWNEFGTDTPGEMLCYQLWRLDQLGIYLDGRWKSPCPWASANPGKIWPGTSGDGRARRRKA